MHVTEKLKGIFMQINGITSQNFGMTISPKASKQIIKKCGNALGRSCIEKLSQMGNKNTILLDRKTISLLPCYNAKIKTDMVDDFCSQDFYKYEKEYGTVVKLLENNLLKNVISNAAHNGRLKTTYDLLMYDYPLSFKIIKDFAGSDVMQRYNEANIGKKSLITKIAEFMFRS